MSEADEAKDFLLGKEMLNVFKNNYSIKFFVKYTKDNKRKCLDFLKSIRKYCTINNTDGKKVYFFDMKYPYGNSILTMELRSSETDTVDSMFNRWEFYEQSLKGG